MTTWQEQMYQELFDAACEFVAMRRSNEPDFTIHTLRRLLNVEYTREGMEWIGKDTLQEIRLTATIAAYEHLLAEWERE